MRCTILRHSEGISNALYVKMCLKFLKTFVLLWLVSRVLGVTLKCGFTNTHELCIGCRGKNNINCGKQW